MYAALSPISRANTRFYPRRSCRFISGRRYPWKSANRSFHATKVRHEDPSLTRPQSSHNDKPTVIASTIDDQARSVDWNKYEKALAQGRSLLRYANKQWPGIVNHLGAFEDQSPDAQEGLGEEIGTTYHGSWRRRFLRNMREEKVISLPKIPKWFLDQNVTLASELPERDDLVHVDDTFKAVEVGGYAQSVKNTAQVAQKEGSPRHRIDQDLFNELLALSRTGLQTATKAKEEDVYFSKPHLNLVSPYDGATGFLERVTLAIAKKLDADVIELGPVAISELAHNLAEELPKSLTEELRHTGYQAYRTDDDFLVEEQEEDDTTDYDPENPTGLPGLQNLFNGIKRGLSTSRAGNAFQVGVLMPGRGYGKDDLFGGLDNGNAFKLDSIYGTGGTSSFPSMTDYSSNLKPMEATSTATDNNTKVNLVMETLLDTAAARRYRLSGKDDSTMVVPNPLIVMVPDFLMMRSHRASSYLIDRLVSSIRQRRVEGQQILLIGLTASEEAVPLSTTRGLLSMQTNQEQWWRTIVTTPSSWDSSKIYEEDIEERTRHINIRHLQEMLRGLAWQKSLLEPWCSQNTDDIDQTEFADYFNEAIWSNNRIHRIATAALGFAAEEGSPVTLKIVGKTLKTVTEADVKKIALIQAKEDEENGSQPDVETPLVSDVLTKARRNANTHEKKLLHGVIDRKDIKTSFSSVHVPGATVRALKTLTSLSLQRPEAFTYGVLATDKIPGLLLYGPPGTGKTLLAKAVAGESGATVLEVSGSDIYNMYVGEGEKNVRAIFTLAQKLSPCVVFIDEADAILGSRNSHGNRTTHRELINQFLREWDGLSSRNTSAFIMVATNRPFDLDDAVLRRLPRRLLVDLPTEKDREAILKIHLAEEKLEESVSLSSLAARTPFYSGSDLKNVCVAAALQAVQEEYDAKLAFEAENKSVQAIEAGETAPVQETELKDTQPAEYVYPIVRTLTNDHFNKALSDISASISEDMSSLVAIRKFDEKYGDHRGKKKKGGLGFGTRNEADTERERREEGRVRKEVLAEA